MWFTSWLTFMFKEVTVYNSKIEMKDILEPKKTEITYPKIVHLETWVFCLRWIYRFRKLFKNVCFMFLGVI